MRPSSLCIQPLSTARFLQHHIQPLNNYTKLPPATRALFIKTSHPYSQTGCTEKSLLPHQPRAPHKKTELSAKMHEKLNTNPQPTKTPITNRAKIFRMSYIKNRCLMIIRYCSFRSHRHNFNTRHCLNITASFPTYLQRQNLC